jgi:ABC-type multidrug transport system fused ATPase/permease subunit
MRKSIEDRLSDIEHSIKKLDLNTMLTLQSQNTESYYHTSLFSEQNAAPLLSSSFGIVSLLALSISTFALWKGGGEMGWLIAAFLIFVFAIIFQILVSLKLFFLWRANKVMEEVISSQKKINELISTRINGLAKELGFDVNGNIQTSISKALEDDSSVTR